MNDKTVIEYEDDCLVPFDFTNAALEKLRFKFAKVPEFSSKSDDGYTQCNDSIKQLRTGWVQTDKKRQELNKDLIAEQKLNNGAGKHIMETLKTIAEPWVAAKKLVDEAAEKLAEEKRQKEEKRIEVIENKIADIGRVGNYMAGASAADLKNRLESLDLIVIDELYGEFQEAAASKKEAVGKVLSAAITATEAHEASQALVKEQAAAMAEQQKEMDAKQKILDEEAEHRAAEKKLQDAEMEDRRQEILEMDKRIAEEKREVEFRAAEEKRLAEEKVAAEKLAKETAETAKKQAAALKARMPEDQKLRAYADALQAVEKPEVKLEHSCDVLASVERRLSDILDEVFINTQAPAKKAAKKKKAA